MHFKPMEECPMREGVPFLVLRHGNDVAAFLIQQVQAFEGNLYPDQLDGAIDRGDRITDAVGWCDIGAVHAPLTIEATLRDR
jgi:hypothetical protein